MTNVFYFLSRYLLQIMLEASCLELASIVSIVLKDSLALIRIVNAARTSSDNRTTVSRLYHNLKALEAWAQADWLVLQAKFITVEDRRLSDVCSSFSDGYIPFFQAIQPQLNSLAAFLQSSSEMLSSPTVASQQRRDSSSGDPNSSTGLQNHPGSGTKVFQSGNSANTTPNVHRTSSMASGLKANKHQQPKLIAKQRSLPSDMLGTQVVNGKKQALETMETGVSVPSKNNRSPQHQLQKQLSDVQRRSVSEREEDEESVILPEGQDEQAGCTLS